MISLFNITIKNDEDQASFVVVAASYEEACEIAMAINMEEVIPIPMNAPTIDQQSSYLMNYSRDDEGCVRKVLISDQLVSSSITKEKYQALALEIGLLGQIALALKELAEKGRTIIYNTPENNSEDIESYVGDVLKGLKCSFRSTYMEGKGHLILRRDFE